ncbi:hypothetical protein BaRGS_00036632, partial [Batillaria attramentaria]
TWGSTLEHHGTIYITVKSHYCSGNTAGGCLAVTAQGGNGDCDVQEECEFKEILTDPSTPLMPCLTIFFKTSPANSAAGLESPWICATGHNASSLSFRYAITGPLMTMNCSLSVYLNTKINTTRIWTSSGATKYDWMESGNIDIQSPDCPFQLIFEGKKTSDGPCSNAMYNYLSMSDIVYEGVAPAHYHVNNNHNVIDNIGCRSVCGYAHRQINTTACANQGSLSETEPDNNTLGVGAVAGIGVGAVLVIACLIVVLIYVWKKRTKRDKTDSRLVAEGTENSDTLQTVVNPGYQPDNNHTSGPIRPAIFIIIHTPVSQLLTDATLSRMQTAFFLSSSEIFDALACEFTVSCFVQSVYLLSFGERSCPTFSPYFWALNRNPVEDGNSAADRSGKVKSGNFLYEVVDVTELHPIYSEPDDAITPTNASKTKSAEANLQTKSSTEPESSELIYAKPVKPNGPGKDILEQQSAKSEETAEKPKGSEQNNYNKLVLQNPRAKRIDHTPLGLHAYDHLDGVVQSREDGSGLTATRSLSNASSLQGARPGYVNVDLPKPASQQPDQGVYNILDKERPSTPAVNPDVVGDTGLVYNRLNEVAPMNPAELDSAVRGSSSAGPKKRETEELYLNVDHDGVKPVPKSDSGGIHHQLDKDRPKERPSTPTANPDVAVDTGRVYNRLNEVTPVTAPITIKPDSAGHGSLTAGPKKRETDELYMNVDHDGVKPVPTSDSEGHQLDKDHPKERPTTPAAKKGVADTGLVYNRLNEVDPVTAPITTQPGRAGQGTSSAGPKRKGTKELYMNVDHDGVKPVPRSDSGGVYHQLEFDAKDRDQAATASGVYDHTA